MKNEQALEMYSVYMSGKSLSEVAMVYRVTRQSVYSMFSCRGLKMRELPKMNPHIEFNGQKYTVNKLGYYRKTGGNRELMHRDVWSHYKGQIPYGWDIHHKDEDKSNNEISNLECLPKSEHTRLYSPHNNQYTKGRKIRENA